MNSKKRLDKARKDMRHAIQNHENHACPVFSISCELLTASGVIDSLEHQRDQLREALDGLLSYTKACESLLNASESGHCVKARDALEAVEEDR